MGLEQKQQQQQQQQPQFAESSLVGGEKPSLGVGLIRAAISPALQAQGDRDIKPRVAFTDITNLTVGRQAGPDDGAKVGFCRSNRKNAVRVRPSTRLPVASYSTQLIHFEPSNAHALQALKPAAGPSSLQHPIVAPSLPVPSSSSSFASHLQGTLEQQQFCDPTLIDRGLQHTGATRCALLVR
jgi:hypothetical protein